MGFGGRLAVGLAVASALIAVPTALAANPPTAHDPCVQGTRNICGTTGVGYYRTYRYGTRWFGDFKDAVPGVAHLYCIDLRFWYPGPSYRYREETSGSLADRQGRPVPLVNQQRIAYAIWAFGRTSDPDEAAAVMLYVHGQIGDARPGEVDPAVLGGRVPALYDRIAKDAAVFHGPYRVEVSFPSALKAGRAVTATVRVLAAGGAAVPDQPLKLTALGLSGVPAQATTDANGVARLTVTATGGPVKLSASAGGLPSTLPRLFVPTAGAAARNGQRLVLPSAQTVASSQTGTASKSQIAVSSTAASPALLVGRPSRDRVTITNAGGSWRGTVQVRVYGPARTASSISCAGAPAAQTSFTATRGNGTYTTPPVTLEAPGWYVYVEVVPGDAGNLGVTTPCSAPTERFRVDTKPAVITTVSSQSVTPGAQIKDTVKVTGLAGETASVQASLFGPFASRAVIRCSGTPAWTGSITAAGDGTYVTPPFTVSRPGYYTYRESIAAFGFVRAARTVCADTAETTIVTGTPRVATQVSAQQAKPGAAITDKLVVSGLGALKAEVNVDLWGPYASRSAVRCTGTPAWRGTVTAFGDGTYTTAPVRLHAGGYYTFHESVVDTPAYGGFSGACGETAETTTVHASPSLATQVTSQVARPGTGVTDRVKVSGLGATPARIEVTLYGPFATRVAIGCKGTPAGLTSFTARGDGVYTSPPIRISRAGFYVFREHLVGSAFVEDVQTSCTEQSEVSLGAPLVITGRGDVTREMRARARSAALAPTRVEIDSVGIDAPSSAVAIDTAQGVLGVSPDIHHTGWWVDGAQPGDRAGAVVIAGHVDRAHVGPGAFFHLKDASPGDRVRVATAGGRTFAYRVVAVKSYLKSRLPTDVWSRSGPARLVLITCGGPFDAKTRHYRDNIVLTAVPL